MKNVKKSKLQNIYLSEYKITHTVRQSSSGVVFPLKEKISIDIL